MDQFRKNMLPIIAAFIWGTAFVAQSAGAEFLPPFAFNTVRSMIAVATLLAVIWVFSKLRKTPFLPPKEQRKDLLLGGICCGILSCFDHAGKLRRRSKGETEFSCFFNHGYLSPSLCPTNELARVRSTLTVRYLPTSSGFPGK